MLDGDDRITRRAARHVRANVVAYLALFVALCGTAFAAGGPLLDEKGSVTSKNLRDGTIKVADVQGALQKRLGLTATAPQPGTYTGTTIDTTSHASVEVEVVWAKSSGSGQVVAPTSIKLSSSTALCSYATPAGAKFNTLWPGFFRYIGESPMAVLEVSYVDATTTLFDQPSGIQGPGTACTPRTAQLKLN